MPDLDPRTVEALRARFYDVHPLVFHRSWERARTAGELFDILDTLPRRLPIVWDDAQRRWVTVTRLYPKPPSD